MLRLCGLEILKLTHTASVFSTYNSFITSRASSHTRWERKILPIIFLLFLQRYIFMEVFFPGKKKEFVFAQVQLVQIDIINSLNHLLVLWVHVQHLKVSVKLCD